MGRVTGRLMIITAIGLNVSVFIGPTVAQKRGSELAPGIQRQSAGDRSGGWPVSKLAGGRECPTADVARVAAARAVVDATVPSAPRRIHSLRYGRRLSRRRLQPVLLAAIRTIATTAPDAVVLDNCLNLVCAEWEPDQCARLEQLTGAFSKDRPRGVADDILPVVRLRHNVSIKDESRSNSSFGHLNAELPEARLTSLYRIAEPQAVERCDLRGSRAREPEKPGHRGNHPVPEVVIVSLGRDDHGSPSHRRDQHRALADE